jgi:signal transduction histidine kinase
MTTATSVIAPTDAPRGGRLGTLFVGLSGGALIAWCLWLPWNSPWPPPDPPQALAIAANGLASLLWLGAGLAVRARGGSRRMALLLLAMVPASWVWAIGFTATPLTYSLGDTFGGIGLVVFAHALIAFPSGRLAGRFDRRLVAFLYPYFLAGALLPAVTWTRTYNCDPFCNRNVFELWPNDAVHDVTWTAFRLSVPVVAVVVALAVIRHWRRATPAAQRALAPAMVALPLAFAVISLGNLANALNVQPLADALSQSLSYACLGLAPAGLLVALSRTRLGRARVGDLVVQLARGVPLGSLRDVLARALRDPTLEIAYPAPGGQGYVDAAGEPISIPGADGGRAVTRLERDGTLLALLIHDPAVDAEDPQLVEAVGGAAQLALENERLAAEVRAQLVEVRASRARIAEAADAERRRVERDLHDGAQQRLVALVMRLEQSRATTPGSNALIDDTNSELRAAIDEVRSLARGLHPPILAEAGLAAAVESLAERMPLPIEVHLPEGRFERRAEATAYFVVAEALTNVARHAGASHARVEGTLDAERLRLSIADDGQGGARTEGGSGLRGLADRLAAVGGTLAIESPAGAGTTVRAEIPLAPDP